MPDKKVNVFTQHYQPISSATHSQPTPYDPQSVSSGPEELNISNSSEFEPIEEYVEPEIPPELNQHLQQSNPPPQIPLNVPLTPVNPPVTARQLSSVKLPLTEDEIEKDLRLNVYSALRWLAEWCLRQLKELQVKS